MGKPIKHYGVKGMKWGVRKDRSSGGSKSGGSKSTAPKEEKKKLTKSEQKAVKRLSPAQVTEAYEDYQSLTGKKDLNSNDVVEALSEYVKTKGGTSNTSSSGDSKNSSVKKNKKKLSEMSDQELKDAVRRMNLEKQYKKILAEEKSKKPTAKGKKFLGEIFFGAVKDVATSFLKVQMSGYLNYGMKRYGPKPPKLPDEKEKD